MSDSDLSNSGFLNAAARYTLAIGVALFAIALRIWLTPFLGDSNPYHIAWAAVVFSAWYCGIGPSIITTLMSVVNVALWLDVSNPSRILLDRTQRFGMIAFVFFSGVIIAFGESMRRSRSKKERVEQALRESEARLLVANEDMRREIERRTAELERRTDQIVDQAKLIDLANDAIFVRNASDRISYWNQGAERLYGWTRAEAMGRLAHDVVHTTFPAPFAEVANIERWQGELRQIKRDGTPITVASRWTRLRDNNGQLAGWLEINTDVTARKRAEDAARTLSGRILSLQDDERRRIARELHDSLGQYLVSVKVNLDLLSKTVLDSQQSVLLSECLSSVEQSLSETRTISHLLHPPLLDEAGFESAARWYIDGFAQRSAFHVDVDFPKVIGRMNRDVETALFRALQEALTNVHRHSGGSAVQIVLHVDNDRVQLRITDNGRGIPQDRMRSLQEDDAAAGVGLAGMRERMRELGGTLGIAPASPGTTIAVSIPLRDQRGQSSDHASAGANLGASAA